MQAQKLKNGGDLEWNGGSYWPLSKAWNAINATRFCNGSRMTETTVAALQEILAAPQVFYNAEEVIEYLVGNDCPTQAETLLRPFIGRHPVQQSLDDLIHSYANKTDAPRTTLEQCASVFKSSAETLENLAANTSGFMGAVRSQPYQLPTRLHATAVRLINAE